ncbi:MAG: S9 family peptidase [Gemmatimonadaceae bacterium]
MPVPTIRSAMRSLALASGVAAFATALSAQQAAPPVARIVPRVDTTLGDVRTDPYFWLRDDARKNADVIAYLEAENRYTAAVLKPTQALQERLFQEMKGRIKETDLSVPERIGHYYYYSRTKAGKQYPILCRRKGSLTGPEEVMLDENVAAGSRGYYRVGVWTVSPDERLLAFTEDTTGGERYTLVVKDLRKGSMLSDSVRMVNYSLEWAGDNRTLFYGMGDAANRSHRILRHTLGATTPDTVIQEESDLLFSLSLGRTKDHRYLVIEDGSFSSSEARVLRAADPMGAWRVISPRVDDVLYSVEHQGDHFLILTNDRATNFKLMRAPESDPSRARWTEVVGVRDSVLLEGMDVFRNHLVLYERRNAVRQLAVRDLASGATHYVTFPESVSTFRPASNPEYDSRLLRFTYTSMITPPAVYDYNMVSRARTLKKDTEVKGYDKTRYATERSWARASDGAMVPISLVYRAPLARDGKRPMLLTAYGSYGASTDPAFNSTWLSLLDRGLIVAIAHIRGGQEMGRSWYDQGKLLNKKNTFTDFIASAEHLVAAKYTSADRLAIRGGSAGGLLMGAVTNMRPDLFKVVVADVPFVDVINTMMDASIPLTTGEWIQWGDPHKAEYYTYMKSYSPYDNVERKAYPAMLITAGLNDPRVA